MEIERHLKNIRQSDDLSYTDTNTVDITTIKTDDNRRLIDEETLLRLLDDCKDEEARFSIMDEGQQPHQMISRQQTLTAIELDHFDEVARRLQEAEKSVLDVVKIADEASSKLVTIQNQPKKDLAAISRKVEQNLDTVESKLSVAKREVTKFKTKVYDVMADMDLI